MSYNPTIGAFMTRDPIGPVGSGNNLYAYTGDSPINATDPSGLTIYQSQTPDRSIESVQATVMADPTGVYDAQTTAKVADYQRFLRDNGFAPPGLQIDGKWGDQTEQAHQNADAYANTPLVPATQPASTRPATTQPTTAPARIQNLSARGLAFLARLEGLRTCPYDDQTGKPIDAWVRGATIGVGHLIPQNQWNMYKDGITEEEALKLFDNDVKTRVNKVAALITAHVTQPQFDALFALAYNIEVGPFSSSSVLKMVNDPSATTTFTDLESAWKAYNISQGNVNKGLINRRNAEWRLYSTGDYGG